MLVGLGSTPRRNRDLLAKWPCIWPSRQRHSENAPIPGRKGLHQAPKDSGSCPLQNEHEGELAPGKFFPQTFGFWRLVCSKPGVKVWTGVGPMRHRSLPFTDTWGGHSHSDCIRAAAEEAQILGWDPRDQGHAGTRLNSPINDYPPENSGHLTAGLFMPLVFSFKTLFIFW